jgi:hypothetical protein
MNPRFTVALIAAAAVGLLLGAAPLFVWQQAFWFPFLEWLFPPDAAQSGSWPSMAGVTWLASPYVLLAIAALALPMVVALIWRFSRRGATRPALGCLLLGFFSMVGFVVGFSLMWIGL